MQDDSGLESIRSQVPFPILETLDLGDRWIVLFDPDAYFAAPANAGVSRVNNLLAFSKSGWKLWEARLPDAVDYYYRISSKDPLVANSFSSHRVTLDPRNGRIVRTEFVK